MLQTVKATLDQRTSAGVPQGVDPISDTERGAAERAEIVQFAFGPYEGVILTIVVVAGNLARAVDRGRGAQRAFNSKFRDGVVDEPKGNGIAVRGHRGADDHAGIVDRMGLAAVPAESSEVGD